MSKTKMRCITCGKWFQSANAKEVTCPDCALKARKEKLAAKNAPPALSKPQGGVTSPRPAVPPPPKPKPTQSGTAHWLDTLQDVKVGEPDQPPPRPKLPTPAPRDNRGGPGGFRAPNGPGGYRDDRERGPNQREGNNHAPAPYRVGGGAGLPDTAFGQRPRQPSEGGFNRGPRPAGPRPTGPREGGPPKLKGRGKPPTPRPASPPKPKREKTPPPLPFVPTAEQITQVEERYIELATPLEFDGIRTRIAHELGIPKKTVKKIVKDLRDRQDIPSWWELQTYKGSTDELDSIKNVYVPLLPVPEVGIHKQIAEQLDLKPGIVYQAIKAIRLEMNLPQYNDPEVHGSEFVESQKKRKPAETTPETANTGDDATDTTNDSTASTQASADAVPMTASADASTDAVPMTANADAPTNAAPVVESVDAPTDAVPAVEVTLPSEV